MRNSSPPCLNLLLTIAFGVAIKDSSNNLVLHILSISVPTLQENTFDSNVMSLLGNLTILNLKVSLLLSRLVLIWAYSYV